MLLGHVRCLTPTFNMVAGKSPHKLAMRNPAWRKQQSVTRKDPKVLLAQRCSVVSNSLPGTFDGKLSRICKLVRVAPPLVDSDVPAATAAAAARSRSVLLLLLGWPFLRASWAVYHVAGEHVRRSIICNTLEWCLLRPIAGCWGWATCRNSHCCHWHLPVLVSVEICGWRTTTCCHRVHRDLTRKLIYRPFSRRRTPPPNF
jgi:hypothetical protein